MSLPNPRVNRIKRKQIIAKRIRALEKKNLLPDDKRYRRLQGYRNELENIYKE